jgi:multiple sugar transport system permease protein
MEITARSTHRSEVTSNTGKVLNYRQWRQITAWAVIAIALVVGLFPVYWLVLTAFRTKDFYWHYPAILEPVGLSLENISIVLFGSLNNAPIVSFALTSLAIASAATILATTIGVMCAYGLVRYGAGGNFLPMWILSQRFFPGIALIVPLFVLYRQANLLDTYHGLILLYVAFNIPLATWLMIGHIQGLPAELEEAALVEGASYWQMFRTIVLPLVKPGLAITAMFVFIFSWNEYLFAFQLANNQVSTITVYIPRLRGSTDPYYGQIAAASLLSVIPACAFAWFLQRYLIAGLTAGGVKDL